MKKIQVLSDLNSLCVKNPGRVHVRTGGFGMAKHVGAGAAWSQAFVFCDGLMPEHQRQ